MTEARMEIKLGIKIKLGDSYQNYLTRQTTHCVFSWSKDFGENTVKLLKMIENMIENMMSLGNISRKYNIINIIIYL